MPTERQLVDAYTHRALLLLRVADGVVADASKELRDLADDLRRLLATVDLSAMGRRDLTRLLRDIEEAIDERYEAIAVLVDQAMSEIEQAEWDWTLALFGMGAAAAALWAARTLPTRRNRLLLGLPLSRRWQRQTSNAGDRIGAIIRTIAAGGLPVPPGGSPPPGAPAPSPTEQAIRAIIGAGPRGRERGGAMETERTQVGTIVRTAVRAGVTDVQREAWEKAGVRYLKWHSILDTRTTIGCGVRAGKLYTLDLEPVNHDIPIDRAPPRHFNCRSLLAPMAPDFEPPGDGQDPYTESLDDWLKRQPDEVQNEVLGPQRAALWRAGRITARDLLGRNGEPLSVADLAAMAGPEARVMTWAGEANYRRLAGELTPEMRAAGAEFGLTEAEMVALRHYTEDGYDALNAALREGRAGRSTIAADVLNGALDKLPAYNGPVVRRVQLDADALAKHVPGNVVDYPAFTSATKNLERDVMRRKPHRLIIESRTGRSIAPWSAAEWQDEVLFGYPRRFEVMTRKAMDGYIEIKLRELP